MFRTLSRRRPPSRRGAILLVVLTLLALFAVIGLSFALYAESEATAARIHREGESRTGEEQPSPVDYVNAALRDILYPVSDLDPVAAQSGFRGYELARLMYGYNPYSLGGGGHDLSPFNGLGLFINGQDSLNILGTTIDRSLIVNYSYQAGLPAGSQLVLDPEWSQFRTNISDPSTFSTRTYHSIAAPYTYPDLKDLPLAVFNPTTGAVTQPSYYRTYGPFTSTGGAGLSTGLEPINPNWATPQGRLYIIRPRPIDHLLPAELTALGANPTPAAVQAAVASAGAFPYPPANADGSYTGDVQNIPNPQGQQRNDAMWIFPAGPVRRWNGRLYTALVAPTVIELNGRVNLSMAGNIQNNKTHASDAGVGASEINLRWALDNGGLTPASQTALLNIISGTSSLQGRYGTASALPQPDRITGLQYMLFNGGLIPPSYSRADYDGVGSGSDPMTFPAATSTSPFPNFPATRFNYSLDPVTSQPQEFLQHPAQFNPDFYSPIRNQTTSRTFPPFDLLRLGTRYGDQWTRYNQADLAQLAQQYLVSANYPGGTFTTTDAANLVRMLTTTQSSSLTRPEVQVPTGATGTPAVMQYARLGPIDLNRPLADFRVNPGAAPSPQNVYQPSNAAQYLNYALARRARQNFARDIFVRLAALAKQIDGTSLIDGTNVAYNVTTGYLTFGGSVQPQQVANLRSVAQLAANLVDYIDSDDINTAFVWNPTNPTATDQNPALMGMNFIDPSADQSNFAAAQLGTSVVFGTELPRLVVNEAYAELTNNPADIMAQKATNPFRYKFWVELVNPLGATDAVLSDGGAARLQYVAGTQGATTTYPVYQLLVSYPNQGQSGTVYSTALNTTPTNVTGNPFDPSVATNMTTKLQVVNYTSAVPNPNAPMPAPDTNVVLPVQGQAAGTPGSNLGYYVIGPYRDVNNQNDTGFPGGDVNCTLRLPDVTGATPQNTMMYEPGGNAQADLQGATNLLGRTHTITLRRLANPYLPPNDPNMPATDPLAATFPYTANAPANPFITIDFIENVPTRDQVQVTDTAPWNNTQTPPRPSIGKLHVYGAGNGYAGQAYNDNLPPGQFLPVMRQVAPAAMMPPPTVPHSFFYANNPFGDPGAGSGGSLTTAGTLAWMTHLDRQLLNPLEAVSVAAVPPALVTQQFTAVLPPQAPSTTPTLSYNRHTAESLFLPGLSNGVLTFYSPLTNPPTAGSPPYPVVQPSQAGTVPNSLAAGFLSRGLDLLTVRSFLTGVPVGGREQGKLNINTVWHAAVLRALLDCNSGNYFTDSDVNNIWQQMTNAGGSTTYPAARSQWGGTAYGTTGTDSPIWGLSAFDSTLNTPTANPTSLPGIAAFNNLQRTILRSPDNGTSGPMFYNLSFTDNMAPNLPPSDPTHAAVLTEPLRKAWNSTTTTGNTFLVVMTVGYFEVRNTNYQPGDRVFLGKELYKEVPGDLRQKFVSVIDRSNLSVDLTSPVTNPTTGTAMGYLQGYTTTANAPPQPWFTNLLDDVQPTGAPATFRVSAANVGGAATVYVNGSAVTLAPNQQFWLGYGNFALNNGDGEIVTISTVTPGANGIATITTALPVQRYHPAGSPVSNQLLGNPGPQPSFDFRDRRYQGVVPYCVRVTPAP